jgi:hypothetical protein
MAKKGKSKTTSSSTDGHAEVLKRIGMPKKSAAKMAKKAKKKLKR